MNVLPGLKGTTKNILFATLSLLILNGCATTRSQVISTIANGLGAFNGFSPVICRKPDPRYKKKSSSFSNDQIPYSRLDLSTPGVCYKISL